MSFELDEFEIVDEKLLESSCIIISNDGKAFAPAKGKIKCKLSSKEHLETQIDIYGVEAKEGIEVNEAFLKSVNKYDCHIKFKGKCTKT